ncbi:MAG: zinc-dependent metalloprotease family protein [Actinomycetota bacterium]|nr:zinc-dependent metalloprotease family protein [Actinomycetota bacterium]
MVAVRQRASCIGVAPSAMSVRHDLLGQLTRRVAVSLRTELNRLGAKHTHVNCIRVGSDQFTFDDLVEIDSAIATTRRLYAGAGVAMGIGRVMHWVVSTADANGRDVINSDGEAETLTDEWTVPNDALDVFFVRMYIGGTAGLSRVDGPCDKNAKGMDGSVVEMNAGGGASDFAAAHEMGHYLGLSHITNGTRLMNPTIPNGGQISSAEANNMRDHCRMKNAC